MTRLVYLFIELQVAGILITGSVKARTKIRHNGNDQLKERAFLWLLTPFGTRIKITDRND